MYREARPNQSPRGLLPFCPGHGPWSVTPGHPFPAVLIHTALPATPPAVQDVKPCLFFPGSWKAHPVGLKNSSGPHKQAWPRSATPWATELGPLLQTAGRGPQEEAQLRLRHQATALTTEVRPGPLASHHSLACPRLRPACCERLPPWGHPAERGSLTAGPGASSSSQWPLEGGVSLVRGAAWVFPGGCTLPHPGRSLPPPCTASPTR